MSGFQEKLFAGLKTICDRISSHLDPQQKNQQLALVEPKSQPEAMEPDDGYKLPVPHRLGALLMKAAYDPFSLTKQDCAEIRKIEIAPLTPDDTRLAEKTMEVLDALRLVELAVSVDLSVGSSRYPYDSSHIKSFHTRKTVFANKVYGILSNMEKGRHSVVVAAKEMLPFIARMSKRVIEHSCYDTIAEHEGKVERFAKEMGIIPRDLLDKIAQPRLKELMRGISICDPQPEGRRSNARSSFARAGVSYQGWNNGSVLRLTALPS